MSWIHTNLSISKLSFLPNPTAQTTDHRGVKLLGGWDCLINDMMGICNGKGELLEISHLVFTQPCSPFSEFINSTLNISL